jgi:uncharacterized membrane-anchored protein
LENYNQTNQEAMSVKDWLITLFLTAIPVVGFIMLLVWAFGDGANKTKSNFAKAGLILMLVGIVFYILIFVVFAAAFMAGLEGGNTY